MLRPLSGIGGRAARLLEEASLSDVRGLQAAGELEAQLREQLAVENGVVDHSTLLSAVVEGDLSDWPQEAQSSVCGVTWEANAIAYKCRTCEVDPTCAICVECFRGGDHTGHDYSIIRTGGGCCDCGDAEAWSTKGFCSRHAIDSDRDTSTLLEPSLAERLTICSSVAVQLVLILGVDARPLAPRDRMKTVESLMQWFNRVVAELGDGGRYVVSQALLQPTSELEDAKVVGAASWMHALMKLAGHLPPRLSDCLQKLFISLLGDSSFKLALAEHLIDMYEDEWKAYGSDSAMLGLSVQLFTVPSVMPLLAEKRFVSQLIGMLSELFRKFMVKNESMGTEILMTRDVAFQTQRYFRVAVDLKYLMSTTLLRHHSIYEDPATFYEWVDVLIMCNEMQPCKCKEEESSHEVCFAALYLERHLKAITLRFMDAFITGADGEPLDFGNEELRQRALGLFKAATSRCWEALHRRNPCGRAFRTSEHELSLFLPMHRMLAQIFERCMRYWKFSLDELVEAAAEGKQLVRLMVEAPLRALAMGGQVSAKLWERCSMSLLYIADHLRSEHIRRSQIEADLFVVQAAACTLGGSAVTLILLNRFEVLRSFSFDPAKCHVVNDRQRTTVLIEEALDALIAVGTDRAVSGRDAMDYLALRRLVLHTLFVSSLTHSKLEKITPKYLRPSLDDVLAEVADRVQPSDGQPAIFTVKKHCWAEFDPYYVGYTRRSYELATERYFSEHSKGVATIIPCPATDELLRGMGGLVDIFSSPLCHSCIFWGLFNLVRPQDSDVMTSGGIVRCCTNLMWLSLHHRKTGDKDPSKITVSEIVQFVADAAQLEQDAVKGKVDDVLAGDFGTIAQFVTALWDALDDVAPLCLSLKEEVAPRLLFWLEEAEAAVAGDTEGLRERLSTPVQDASSMVFYGSDIMFNARQRFTVDVGSGKASTHSMVSLLSAIRQSEEPKCTFAHGMVDKLLDILADNDRNKELISKADNGKREAEARARLLASKELRRKKQEEIMARFKARQSQFLRDSADAKVVAEAEAEAAAEPGDGQGEEMGEGETDYCALCREELDPSDAERPFGFVSLAQRSDFVLKVRERATKTEMEANEHCEEAAKVEERLAAKPISRGRGVQAGRDWFTHQVERYRYGVTFVVDELPEGDTEEEREAAREAQRTREMRDVALGIVGRPISDGGHIQSCGHMLHQKCHQDYCETLAGAQESDGRFKCPLCRSISNTLIPVLPRGTMARRWRQEEEEEQEAASASLSEQTAASLLACTSRLSLMFPTVERLEYLQQVANVQLFLWYTIEATELEMRSVGEDLPEKRLTLLRALVCMATEAAEAVKGKGETEMQLRSFCVNEPRCDLGPSAMAGADLFALLVLRVICAPALYGRRCTGADFAMICTAVIQPHWVQVIHALCATAEFRPTASAPACARVEGFVRAACAALGLPSAASRLQGEAFVASLAAEVQARSMAFLRCAALLHRLLFAADLPVSGCTAEELLGRLTLEQLAVPAWIENWSTGAHWRLAETAPFSVPPFQPLATVCLPSLFQDFVYLPRFSKYNCGRCHQTPKSAAMCLLCGTIVCANSSCCRDVVGECNMHMAEACGTDCLFLILQSSRVIMLRAGGIGCAQKSPYVDEHGEEDVNMSRGKELHLQPAALDRLLLLLLQHRIQHESMKSERSQRTRWYDF